MSIKIFVTDLHEYTCGNLVGKWFDVKDYTDMDAMLDECHIGWNEFAENERNEWFVSDYESEEGVDISEFFGGDFPWLSEEEIEQLKELAELSEDNEDLIVAMSEAGYCINDIINEHDDHYLVEADNYYDLGYELISECYDIEKMMGTLSSYFDYEAFGRDCVLGGDYTETSKGYLRN